MTVLDQTQDRATAEQSWSEGRRPGRQQRPQQGPGQDQRAGGVSRGERAVALAAGSILTALGIARRSVPGVLVAGLGGALLYRGATGKPVMDQLLGTDGRRRRREDDEGISDRGVDVQQAFLINRSAEELYGYWRNLENLPRIMSYLESVRVLDDRRSHWVAKAPGIAGGRVEWDAEITDDKPNSRIAWHSLPGSEIHTFGEVRFVPAMGDRGTEVHVTMEYLPPAGRVGHWLAKLFGQSPRRTIREDLRNFKRVMEIGEVPTIIGQPRGTCMGEGKRQATE